MEVKIINILNTLDKLTFEDDYKTQLEDILKDMRDTLREASIDTRHDYVTRITDIYINQTGERPDNVSLYNLTNIYLYDYLEGDTNVHKVAHNEYPILTEVQKLRRTTGQRRERNVIGVTNQEVPLSHAFNIGTDGNNHALPSRYYK